MLNPAETFKSSPWKKGHMHATENPMEVQTLRICRLYHLLLLSTGLPSTIMDDEAYFTTMYNNIPGSNFISQERRATHQMTSDLD